MIQEGEESFRLPVHHPVPSKRQSSKAAEPKLRVGHARMRRFATARSAWMFFSVLRRVVTPRGPSQKCTSNRSSSKTMSPSRGVLPSARVRAIARRHGPR